MSETKILIIGRLIASTCCACGAVYIASLGLNGWGWLIFASLLLGGMTFTNE